jgi:glycosyltransferase involved in cell wall biosynthesis
MSVDEIVVIIPARDEERRIGRCLEAVRQARQELSHAHPEVAHRVLVVLDRCTDRTADIVATADVDALTGTAGLVGVARAAGAAAALRDAADPARVWLACTDADSAVPVDWLVTQLAAARAGAVLLLGTVRPLLPPQILPEWLRRHDVGDGHPHVHGANLGVRGDAYLSAGGFPAVAEHEDRLLVERIRAIGGPVLATGASPVLTSARTVGRTAGGFAGWMGDFLTGQEPLQSAG